MPMNVMVFDTETAGCKTQTLLNIGYKVFSINPKTFDIKTLCQRDYIVRAVFQNELFMLNDMFVGVEKYEQLKANVANGGAKLRTIEQIFAQMESDILRNKVTAGYAYNSNFDTDKFCKTAGQYGINNPIETLPIFDLWGMAYEFICSKPDYLAFCKEHQMLTETKRFFKTSVESVVAFLTDNVEFVEDHTALSDVQWETKIFQECLRRGANPFQQYDHCFIPSDYEFEKTLYLPNSKEPIVVKYKKMSKKWDNENTSIVFSN